MIRGFEFIEMLAAHFRSTGHAARQIEIHGYDLRAIPVRVETSSVTGKTIVWVEEVK